MSSGIVLQSCPKRVGPPIDKVRTPAETLAWVKTRLARVAPDMLRETRRVDHGRLGIPVYISLGGPEAERMTGRQGQMGKGATPTQAEVSAVMELVERYSLHAFAGTFTSTTSKVPPARGARAGGKPARGFDLAHLARSVHDQSGHLDRLRPILDRLPLGWTWARNLTREQDQLIPFRWFHQIHETNGASAGNTLEEAALQALCEVVERHVTSIVAHEHRPVPAIDPASCTDPAASQLIAKFLHAGIRLHLLDFTLDTGVPSIGALAFDPASFPESSELVFAVGTTPSPTQSLVRALTEVAQLAADFRAKTRYHPGAVRFDTLEDARFLLEPHATVALNSLPALSSSDLRTELLEVVQRLSKSDLEVFLVDMTHPVLMIPAVYAVVPGAHFRERTRREGVLFHTARLAAEIHNPVEAVATMREIQTLFPNRYESAFFLGFALERAGRPTEALPWFRQALTHADQSRSTAIQLHIGACLYLAGAHDQAIDALQAGIHEAQPDAEGLKDSLRLLGACLMARGRHSEGMAALEQAAEIDARSVWDYAGGTPPRQAPPYPGSATTVFAALDDLDGAMARVRRKLDMLHIRIEGLEM